MHDGGSQSVSSERRIPPAVSYILFGVRVAGAVALAMWQVPLALRGLFVFRETEPLSAWVAVGSLLGTLPAALLAVWYPRLAARVFWVLAAGLLGASVLNLERYDSWLSDAMSWLARGPAARALVGRYCGSADD